MVTFGPGSESGIISLGLVVTNHTPYHTNLHIVPHGVYSSPRDSDQPSRPPAQAVSGTTVFVFATSQATVPSEKSSRYIQPPEYTLQVCAEDFTLFGA